LERKRAKVGVYIAGYLIRMCWRTTFVDESPYLDVFKGFYTLITDQVPTF